ncbi:MAG: hypothetical protein ABMA01_00445 [Chthoniobacteraceae bacterium]
MKARFWKGLALAQVACIVALIVGSLWWDQETRTRTRVATLRALYDYLKPPPPDGAVRVPIVVDLTLEEGVLRRFVNAQQMDRDQLAEFAAMLAKASEMDPIIVRPAPGLPIERVIETLRIMTAGGLKIFIFPFQHETLAITDRNITSEGVLPDLPPESPGGSK